MEKETDKHVLHENMFIRSLVVYQLMKIFYKNLGVKK